MSISRRSTATRQHLESRQHFADGRAPTHAQPPNALEPIELSHPARLLHADFHMAGCCGVVARPATGDMLSIAADLSEPEPATSLTGAASSAVHSRSGGRVVLGRCRRCHCPTSTASSAESASSTWPLSTMNDGVCTTTARNTRLDHCLSFVKSPARIHPASARTQLLLRRT